MTKVLPIILSVLVFTACSPTAGPDKTIAGAVLGAGWGAGAGAAVGNQLEFSPSGEGAAVGAGLGLVGGAATGLMLDTVENTQIRQDKELASLKIQNLANRQQLFQLQATLDDALSADLAAGIYQVFFDPDMTSLRAGAIANLETIAENLKTRANGSMVNVEGHTDDTGNPDYNDRLSQARASSVVAYLTARGLSGDQISVTSHGAKRPIATNSTQVGRQLNRRVDIFVSAN